MASEGDGPKNRRARRAAAHASGKAVEPPTTFPTIKLAQPDRSKPTEKTLLDLYEDKQSLLEHGQPFNSKHEDGQVRDEEGNILQAGLGDGDPIGPVGDAVFWAVSLGMFHFTLDVLTYNQYRQEIEWSPIVKRSLTVLPVLWLLTFILRSRTAKRWATARQILFLIVAVAAGCYTIRVANEYSYYAVMKQAPPLGTLWVWSVIEMNLPYAVASLIIDAAYLYLSGYSIF